MNWDSWIALTALVLALAGLLLQWKRGFSKLDIEAKQGIPVYGEKLGDMQLQIAIRNRRQASTQVRRVWVEMPDGRSLIDPNPISEQRLPFVLGSFESTIVLFPYREIASIATESGYKGSVKMSANVEDGSGRKHRDWFRIEVDDWAEVQAE